MEQSPALGAVRFQRHAPDQFAMVSVIPVAVAVPAVSVTARGVAASEASEAAPKPEAFLARTLNRYAVPSVSPVSVCDRLDAVLSMSLQSASQAFSPSFLLYCHFVSVAVPVTEEVSRTVPSPRPTVSTGFAGFGGRVATGAAVASTLSSEQVASLYALKVQAVFESRLPTVAESVPAATSVEQSPALGAVRFQRHAPDQWPMVSVMPVAVAVPAVRVAARGVAAPRRPTRRPRPRRSSPAPGTGTRCRR